MVEVADMDEEAAFAHLQELVGELPVMEALGEKARLAHAAADVRRVAHELEVARATFARSEAELADARGHLAQAEAAGDAAQADSLRREALFLADRLSLAKGPVNDAEFRLAKLLKREGLVSADEAGTHALDPAALAALDARIAAYRDDYQRTYALCQGLGDARG